VRFSHLRALIRRIVTVLGFIVLAVADPASAHNSLRSSSPADGEQLASAPTEWIVTFANEVLLESTSGQLTLADGTVQALPAPTFGEATNTVRFTLPANLSGVITAQWRLVSSDGHAISGGVRFAVGDVDEFTGLDSDVLSAGATASSSTGAAPEVVRWILRLVGFAALMVIGGLLLAELHLVRGAFSALRRSPVLKVTAVTIAAVPAVQLLIFLGDVHGTSIFGGIGHLLSIFDTTPGSMLFVRTAAGVALGYQLISVMPFTESTKIHRLVVATFGLYLVALAYTGHSRSMAAPYLGIPADVVHTAAAAAWLGGLAVLVLFVAPLVSTRDLFRAFQRYGQVAKPAVIALLVTGVIQTLRLHGGIGSLFTEGHGRLLLLKIALVAVTLRLGDINRKRVSSKMMENPHIFDTRMAVLLRMGTMEIVSGAGILAVTAALVGASLD
jgi:copper transport protein